MTTICMNAQPYQTTFDNVYSIRYFKTVGNEGQAAEPAQMSSMKEKAELIVEVLERDVQEAYKHLKQFHLDVYEGTSVHRDTIPVDAVDALQVFVMGIPRDVEAPDWLVRDWAGTCDVIKNLLESYIAKL